jgi:hypothetical protein
VIYVTSLATLFAVKHKYLPTFMVFLAALAGQYFYAPS